MFNLSEEEDSDQTASDSVSLRDLKLEKRMEEEARREDEGLEKSEEEEDSKTETLT